MIRRKGHSQHIQASPSWNWCPCLHHLADRARGNGSLRKPYGAIESGWWHWGCPPWGWPGPDASPWKGLFWLAGCGRLPSPGAGDGAGVWAGQQLLWNLLAGSLGLVAAGTQLLPVAELESTCQPGARGVGSFPTFCANPIRSQGAGQRQEPQA